MKQKFSNNGSTLLALGIDDSITSILVDSGTGARFPTLGANEFFMATLEDAAGVYEIVKVTARVGDGMTVVRAQEGTVAAAFVIGDRFELRTTAGTMEGFLQKDGDVLDGGTF